MMQKLLIMTAISLTVAPCAAHAMAVGAASGFSWNQPAADASARAWAAEGICFPGGWFSWWVPCAALEPPLPPNRPHARKHNHKFAN